MCKKFLKNRKNLSVQRRVARRSHFNVQAVKVANLLMLLVLMSGLVGYIGLVNKRAVSGYKISALNQRLNKLKSLEEKLTLNLAEVRRHDNIKQKAAQMQLVALPEVEYLVRYTKSLAQR